MDATSAVAAAAAEAGLPVAAAVAAATSTAATAAEMAATYVNYHINSEQKRENEFARVTHVTGSQTFFKNKYFVMCSVLCN